LVKLFIDTSALYAFVDHAAAEHEPVERAVDSARPFGLVTHGYVAVEALALVRRRLGPDAAVRLIDDGFGSIDVHPVDADLHTSAVETYRVSGAIGPSFVDRVSFEFMRREGIDTAIAVDSDFVTAGFRVIPEPRPIER
jgi:predicted nucleic acid-binding protein